MDGKTQAKILEYTKQIQSLKNQGINSKPGKAEAQIDRLLNEKFYNPYDVLLLNANASDDQLKKQYRNFSLLLHPDRCKDPRAKDAFHVVQQSHKTLLDPEKRKVYLRIMKQAKERAQFQRDRENKKRQKNGQKLIDQSTFPQFYQEICLKIFKDLDEKKQHLIRLQQSNHQKKMDELQTRKMVEQYRILTQQQWQRSREKRVSNWRDFNKQKFVVGSKRSNGSIRPPPVRSQSRPHYTTVEDRKKNA